ncbi:hypothetical protein NEDG_02119 [Nematocida displodere]|uniref:Uncharacterized protein n=1 Tax=Nematocida displodere TaxID=1805483 RepID=A0A177EMB4_9MICR|nr:hypothetical protein NEDG_01429 [Nematocida displodere]OAG32252.1 hypothetical protein NEDG_02119 [Nematocida displodere]
MLHVLLAILYGLDVVFVGVQAGRFPTNAQIYYSAGRGGVQAIANPSYQPPQESTLLRDRPLPPLPCPELTGPQSYTHPSTVPQPYTTDLEILKRPFWARVWAARKLFFVIAGTLFAAIVCAFLLVYGYIYFINDTDTQKFCYEKYLNNNYGTCIAGKQDIYSFKQIEDLNLFLCGYSKYPQKANNIYVNEKEDAILNDVLYTRGIKEALAYLENVLTKNSSDVALILDFVRVQHPTHYNALRELNPQ